MSSEDPHDGVIRPKPGTSDKVASRVIDGTVVEVRSGRFDGVTITDKTGHETHNHQVKQQDPDTKEALPNLIISSALGEGKRGVPSAQIGEAMDAAVARAFANADLSEDEARQFKVVSEKLSDSLENHKLSRRETRKIVHKLNHISRDTGRE